MTVIGTVGLPGSGKGEAAAVAERAGLPVVTMGDVIREECRRRGLDPAQHHGEIAQRLREEEGDDAIAARTLPKAREALADHEVVVVDGIRSDVEVDRFRAAFGEEFVLVSIEAPFEVRAERLDARERDDTDVETLRERDERELGFGMGAAMDDADVRIDNTGTLAAFRERIRELLADAGADVDVAGTDDDAEDAAGADGDGNAAPGAADEPSGSGDEGASVAGRHGSDDDE